MELSTYLGFAALALMIDAGLSVATKTPYKPAQSIALSLAWPFAAAVMFVGAIVFTPGEEGNG